MMKTLLAFALALLLASCAPAASGISMTGSISTAEIGTVVPVTLPPSNYTPPPAPTNPPSTAIPSLPGGLSPTELKYRLLEQYPNFFFCDPDYYPVAHDDELSLALARFPQIRADTGQFQAILEHNGLTGLASLSDDQKMLVYGDYKKLNALFLELAGDKYRFQFQVSNQDEQAFFIKGTIDGQGKITVQSKDPTIAICPICLALGTLIDTPRGPVAVQDLHPGDLVWTLNSEGRRIAAPILRTGHVRVPSTHRMAHILLDDGRELLASPGHPTADGRTLGSLHPGDFLDGAHVLRLELVPYTGGATYDILPSGGTGFYWADAILAGSTLAE